MKQILRVIPTIEHVSLHVMTGKTGTAIDFFESLGWELWPDRHAKWSTGQAVFVHPPSVSVYIQLTEETAQKPGAEGSATHVALVCNVQETLQTISDWTDDHGLIFNLEEVGGGKLMITIPGLFNNMAFELVPVVHPELFQLVTQAVELTPAL